MTSPKQGENLCKSYTQRKTCVKIYNELSKLSSNQTVNTPQNGSSNFNSSFPQDVQMAKKRRERYSPSSVTGETQHPPRDTLHTLGVAQNRRLPTVSVSGTWKGWEFRARVAEMECCTPAMEGSLTELTMSTIHLPCTPAAPRLQIEKCLSTHVRGDVMIAGNRKCPSTD